MQDRRGGWGSSDSREVHRESFQPRESFKGFAVFGVMLAIASLVTLFVPMLATIPFALAFLGLSVGAAGLLSQRRSDDKVFFGISLGLGILACVVVLVFGIVGKSAEVVPSESSEAVESSSNSGASANEVTGKATSSSGDALSSGDYAVTIDDAKVTKGFDSSVLVVTFTWTNNSAKEQSAFESLFDANAYQGGIELDYGLPNDDSNYNYVDISTRVKPGISISFMQAYSLRDSSDVSIEVTEGGSKQLVASTTVSLQ